MTRHLLFLVAMGLAAIAANAHSRDDSSAPPALQPYRAWIQGTTQSLALEEARRNVLRHLTQSNDAQTRPDLSWSQAPVGVFVTAMKGPAVRACVGALHPKANTFSGELARQCKRLAFSDPRHPPLSIHEINDLVFVITLAGPPTPAAAPERIDIFREGLLAEWNGKAAALLPGEAKTLEWGLRHLRRQLHIKPNETPNYFSIPTLIMREPEPKESQP